MRERARTGYAIVSQVTKENGNILLSDLVSVEVRYFNTGMDHAILEVVGKQT